MKPRRILLVDDDRTTLMAVGNLLRRDRHEVTTCADTAEGVSLALRSAWDLIVLDLDFGSPRVEVAGGFDGLTLSRWLRTAGRTTPVLLLTASDSEDLDNRAESVGGTSVVRKSEPPRRILEATRIALESSEGQVVPKKSEEIAPSPTPTDQPQLAKGFFKLAVARLRAAVNLFW